MNMPIRRAIAVVLIPAILESHVGPNQIPSDPMFCEEALALPLKTFRTEADRGSFERQVAEHYRGSIPNTDPIIEVVQSGNRRILLYNGPNDPALIQKAFETEIQPHLAADEGWLLLVEGAGEMLPIEPIEAIRRYAARIDIPVMDPYVDPVSRPVVERIQNEFPDEKERVLGAAALMAMNAGNANRMPKEVVPGLALRWGVPPEKIYQSLYEWAGIKELSPEGYRNQLTLLQNRLIKMALDLQYELSSDALRRHSDCPNVFMAVTPQARGRWRSGSGHVASLTVFESDLLWDQVRGDRQGVAYDARTVVELTSRLAQQIRTDAIRGLEGFLQAAEHWVNEERIRSETSNHYHNPFSDSTEGWSKESALAGWWLMFEFPKTETFYRKYEALLLSSLPEGMKINLESEAQLSG